MPVIFNFIVMLFFFCKIRKENTIRRLVFGLYCFSALCSVFYPVFLPVKYDQSFFAYVYYTLCNIILLYPIWYFGNINCKDFNFPEKFINWTSYVLILCGIVSLINIIPQLFTLRTFIANLSEVRSAYYHGEALTEMNSSLIYILANWVMYVQFFSPCFAFLNFIKGKKIMALLLAIVSLVPALNKILIGEREACVVVLSNFLFAYVFFRPMISDENAEKIKKIGLLFTIPLLIFVIAMTFSRFGDSDGGVVSGLLSYFGKQPFNFSYFFTSIDIDQQYLGGRLSFGYLFPENERLEGQINEYINAGEYLNVFAGIPGSLILDFSYATIFLILMFVILFIVTFSKKRNKKTNKYNFSFFMAFLMYYQIIFMGLFYFDFTTKYVVYMCLILFLSYFVMTHMLKLKRDMI